MREFKGRVAVVTGAASGIGLGLAKRFAGEGMAVVMADVEADPLARAAKEVESGGARVLAIRTDVASAKSVAALAAAAEAAFGKIHVLCANAGISRQGSAWDQSLDDWTWALGVNLWGVIHPLRAFVPGMLKHGEEGHVVVTSSAAGLSAASSSSYVASKYAVLGLAEGMEADFAGTALGVTVLCPGGVKTRIFESERTRPAELAQAGTMSAEHVRRNAALASATRTDQVAPDYIAGLVLQAIRDRQLYLLPMQPHFKKTIHARLDRIGAALDAAPDTGV